jgi:hypothetical protein
LSSDRPRSSASSTYTPDRRKDIIREMPFQASPAFPLNTIHDAFGNVMQRAVLPCRRNQRVS